MDNSDKQFFLNLIGDFDQGFGAEYNIFCCEQAIIIAETLQTKDNIITYNKASTEEQKKMVPLLDEGHSGNTFMLSCRLAISYLPQLLSKSRDIKIDKIIE